MGDGCPRRQQCFHEQWFAFSFGSARFIAINSCKNNSGEDFLPGSNQYKWLLNEFRSPGFLDSSWQIVYLHHPVYSSGAHAKEQTVLDIQHWLVPLFETYGIDIVFSGHDHFYERSAKASVQYIVTGGGGVALRDQVFINPYQVLFKKAYHHCLLEITPDQIAYTAVKPDGEIFDSFSLEKAAKKRSNF